MASSTSFSLAHHTFKDGATVPVITSGGQQYMLGRDVAAYLSVYPCNLYKSLQIRNIKIKVADEDELAFLVEHCGCKRNTTVKLLPYDHAVRYIVEYIDNKKTGWKKRKRVEYYSGDEGEGPEADPSAAGTLSATPPPGAVLPTPKRPKKKRAKTAADDMQAAALPNSEPTEPKPEEEEPPAEQAEIKPTRRSKPATRSSRRGAGAAEISPAFDADITGVFPPRVKLDNDPVLLPLQICCERFEDIKGLTAQLAQLIQLRAIGILAPEILTATANRTALSGPVSLARRLKGNRIDDSGVLLRRATTVREILDEEIRSIPFDYNTSLLRPDTDVNPSLATEQHPIKQQEALRTESGEAPSLTKPESLFLGTDTELRTIPQLARIDYAIGQLLVAHQLVAGVRHRTDEIRGILGNAAGRRLSRLIEDNPKFRYHIQCLPAPLLEILESLQQADATCSADAYYFYEDEEEEEEENAFQDDISAVDRRAYTAAMFVPNGWSAFRPFLSKAQFREFVVNRPKARKRKQLPPSMSLRDGDVIHVPFTPAEKKILFREIAEALRNDQQQPDFQYIATRLVGRAAEDCRNYWEAVASDEGLLDGMEAMQIYTDESSSQHSRSSKSPALAPLLAASMAPSSDRGLSVAALVNAPDNESKTGGVSVPISSAMRQMHIETTNSQNGAEQNVRAASAAKGYSLSSMLTTEEVLADA